MKKTITFRQIEKIFPVTIYKFLFSLITSWQLFTSAQNSVAFLCILKARSDTQEQNKSMDISIDRLNVLFLSLDTNVHHYPVLLRGEESKHWGEEIGLIFVDRGRAVKTLS